MFDANDVSVSVRSGFMPASWLQNYFNNIQTPKAIENRNVIRYNLRIFTRIFSLGRKIIFLLKRVYTSDRRKLARLITQ